MKRSNLILHVSIFALVCLFISSISCKKNNPLAEVTTADISQLFLDSLLGGGTITSEGGSPITERGVCWSVGQNPTIGDKRTSDGTGPGEFKSYITGFQTNTTYFFRAYATNANGTAYGQQVSYDVGAMYPEFQLQVSEISTSSVKISVNIICDNALNIYTTGVCYSLNPNPTFGIDPSGMNTAVLKSYSVTLENLKSASLYYYRPYVIFRLYGTTNYYLLYGDTFGFTTKGLPEVKTLSVTSVYDTRAEIRAEVNSTAISSRGVCLAIGHSPTISDIVLTSPGSPGSFICISNNLLPDNTYSVRAFATSSEGTAYGAELTFKTCTGTVTDVSGNLYRTEQIGTQLWMQENLQTTKYNDNADIPLVTDATAWKNSTTPASTWYSNVPGTAGLLYNWYAVNTAKLCPSGWHVPTEAEIKVLLNFTGNSSAVLKNESGFKAIYGGSRDNAGIFRYSGTYGYWWGSTLVNLYPFAWYLNSNNLVSSGSYSKNNGYSVRCLKD